MKKRVIISVINDLSTDQRVAKTCDTIQKLGYDVLLVGRELPNSLPIKRAYKTHRMKLIFMKGALFYVEFNFRLFWYLLFSRCSALHANDLDTLMPNYLVSKIKRKPMVYDSHEYFTEVPELEGRFAKKVWLAIEKSIFPKLKWIYTVNDSIAQIYSIKYRQKVDVVRNVPNVIELPTLKSKEELSLPKNKKLIILQGSGINVDRGGEEAVQAMQWVNDAVLLVIGGGDVMPALKKIVLEKKLEEKIIFHNKMPYQTLLHYTRNADLGLTLDKDSNMNYRFSLPNKLFDYIFAGIPVLASSLVEVQKIVKQYSIGSFIQFHDPEHIAERINELLSDDILLNQAKQNTKKAVEELNWEKESVVIQKIYEEVFQRAH